MILKTLQFTVGFLKTDPKARYQGYTFYFKEGFCWTNVLNPQARLLKAKMKVKSVNDVGSMSLSSCVDGVPNFYFVSLLNSELLFNYYREYVNCTVNIQINDIRQLPVLIPTTEQLSDIKLLYDKAVALKQTAIVDEVGLAKTEINLDNLVKKLYGII